MAIPEVTEEDERQVTSAILDVVTAPAEYRVCLDLERYGLIYRCGSGDPRQVRGGRSGDCNEAWGVALGGRERLARGRRLVCGGDAPHERADAATG